MCLPSDKILNKNNSINHYEYHQNIKYPITSQKKLKNKIALIIVIFIIIKYL